MAQQKKLEEPKPVLPRFDLVALFQKRPTTQSVREVEHRLRARARKIIALRIENDPSSARDKLVSSRICSQAKHPHSASW